MCHSSDYSQMIFEWLKLYREQSANYAMRKWSKFLAATSVRMGSWGLGGVFGAGVFQKPGYLG
ncbi:hypothetical protein C7B67_00130 [filamentous cyanobacterium Phorm 6]|nr:hypothetical protein C7B67_00130 [filamentous cyanobacterium Phorm 6]